METLAAQIIDAHGGTTAVARLLGVGVSTVHSWRTNGIPKSRLQHLRLVGAQRRLGVDIDAIIARHTKVAA